MSNSEGTSLIHIKTQANHPLYTFDSEMDFSLIQYKMITTSSIKGLLPCRKLKLNGSTQLLYITDGCIRSGEIIQNLEKSQTIAAIRQLLQCILYIQNSGYLSLQNIVLNQDYVFWDQRNKEFCMIYIPCNVSQGSISHTRLQQNFAGLLCTLLEKSKVSRTPEWVGCYTYLQDPNHSLKQIADFLDMMPGGKSAQERPSFTLRSINMHPPMQINITKDRFIIGRDQKAVDQFLPSAVVSSIHCEILLDKNGIRATDLKSYNGTYINGHRLYPKKSYELKPHDRIAFADVEFEVCFEGNA